MMLKKHFTFQELILLCGVLLLGAALGAAMSSKNVNDQAYAARCKDNLRRWGLSVKVYADTYNGFLVPQMIKSTAGKNFTLWSDYDSPLRRMVDPAAKKAVWEKGTGINGCPAAPANIRRYSYAHNSEVMGQIHINGDGAHRLSALPDAHKYVVFADSRTSNFMASTYPIDSKDKRIGLHHDNGNTAHLTFIDGRIELLAKKDATLNAPPEIRRKFSPYIDGITEW